MNQQQNTLMPSSEDWAKRHELVRQEAWDLHSECLAEARRGLKRYRQLGSQISISDIVRLAELGSKLGHLATEKTESEPKQEPDSFQIEMREAIRKIYGTKPEPAAAAPPCDTPPPSNTL